MILEQGFTGRTKDIVGAQHSAVGHGFNHGDVLVFASLLFSTVQEQIFIYMGLPYLFFHG